MPFGEGPQERRVQLSPTSSPPRAQQENRAFWVGLGGVGPLEVLEVDILWPRWVARIGVTRSTQACFLAADRQCTELPLLRLPRLVPEVVGCDPCVPRDLARVGWRGLGWKARKHALRLPLLPIGPHERPRLADSFSRLGQARGASPGSLDQRSEEWPLCEGKSGALDASVRPSEGGRELRGPHGRLSSALPRGGGEQGGGGIGAVGRGLGCMGLILAFRGGASRQALITEVRAA